MLRFDICWGMAVAVMVFLLAVDARGQGLLEVDGVELLGEAQLVMSGAARATCWNRIPAYEANKENDGGPMDIWRLDFSVRNGSGRWLDHLIARFQIDSEWPDCTNWDGPDAAGFAQRYPFASIEWAGSIGLIQERGRNVVAPGQILTDTKALHRAARRPAAAVRELVDGFRFCRRSADGGRRRLRVLAIEVRDNWIEAADT